MAKPPAKERTMTIKAKPERDPRPEIQITTDFEKLYAQSIAALGNDEDTYRRGGHLVHIIRATPDREIDESGKMRTVGGAAGIKPMELATLGRRMKACASYMRVKEGKGRMWERTSPPADLQREIHAAGHWPGIRDLQMLTDAPTLRLDGSVVQEKGYDKASGILYLPSAPFAKVADKPSRADAQAAAARVCSIFADFPFALASGPSAVLSAILSIVGRPAIDGPNPLFLVDASMAGTGKSLLCDLIALVALGRVVPKRGQLGKDEEEVRKAITSILASGQRLCTIDNTTNKMLSANFDSLLTMTVWQDRILGASTQVVLPSTCTWIVNGNNVRLGGDTARRTITIRLESKLSDPETRTDFRDANVRATAKKMHPALLVDCLTILRAYVVSGEWKRVGGWGGFEGWSGLVAPAIAWLGMPSPIDAAAKNTSDDADETLPLLTAMVDEVAVHYRNGVRIRDLLAELYGDPEKAPMAGTMGDSLRSVLEEIAPPVRPGAPPDALRVANWLRANRKRVTRSHRQFVNRLDRTGVAMWFAEDLPGAKPLATPSAPPPTQPELYGEEDPIPF